MADVAFLPIPYAYLDLPSKSGHIFLPPAYEDRFSRLALPQQARKEFERGQRSDGWAQNTLEGFLRDHPDRVIIADEKHPLRLGGSALTLLVDHAKGNEYAVLTARGTNRGPIKAPANVLELGYFKNAGGLPNSPATHARPNIIGEVEGVEEIAFLRGSTILRPYELFFDAERALEGVQSRLEQAFPGRQFGISADNAYETTEFGTDHTLVIHTHDEPPVLLDNVVLIWNAEVSALEVGMYLFRMNQTYENPVDTILTGDGIGNQRFAEDIYLADVNDLRNTAWRNPIDAIVLDTTRLGNFSPPPRKEPVEYRWSATLPDLLDATRGKYSFERMLSRIAGARGNWMK